jgi:hypothetical protein
MADRDIFDGDRSGWIVIGAGRPAATGARQGQNS